MNIETILSRPSVRGLEFRLGLEAFAHKTAKSLNLLNISVIWRNDVSTAGMSRFGELYLAGVKDEATVNRAMVVKYAAYVVHELLHRKYTNFFASSDVQYLRVLHNAVEDGWIENTGIATGLLGNIGPLLGEMIDTMTREALASVSDWNNPAQYPYILAVHCRAHATVKCPTNPRLAPIFDEAAKRCQLATNSYDTLEIAVWVYDQIKQESQKPKEESNGKPKDGDKGQPKDGEEAKDAPPEGQEAPTSPGKPKGEGEGADKAKDAPVGNPSESIAREVEPSLNEPSSGGSYSTDEDVRVDGYHLREHANLRTAALPVSAKLRYEVKRLFDNSGLSEFTRNRKAGVVNVHALPSVAAGNDRVFKRRLDVEGVDSAVVICLDVSGSMFTDRSGGSFIRPAVQTCRALLETLSAAGVKTCILSFGNHVSQIKGFDKNPRSASQMLDRVVAGGGTNDYTALRYAHQILAKRTENRKLVFVITDGRGNPRAVKQQSESGKALGITTVGIGIQADVSDIYGQAVTINNIGDLGNASFKQIKLAA